jgi:hypothetical protein
MDADSLDYLRHVGMGNKSDAKTYFQHTLGITPDASKTDLSRWKRKAGKDQRDILRYKAWAENPEMSYFLSKGEVEARNVQQRAMLSPEERKVMSPWSTEGDFRRAGKLFGMSDSPKQEGISMMNFPRELAIHTPPKFPYLNQRLGILGDR